MYEKITLANGVRILTEPVPGMRSAALGIWVGTGSRDEKAAENGAAHFIEHMVFKGTARRTAAQLAQEMDAIGGQVNAFTTKECTCFHARVLDDHLPRAIDLLCDMLLSSNFAERDVATERGVILEEIGMYADNPEDLCAERLAAAVYRGNPLARPILGKRATLEKMDGRWLRDYMASHYTPDKIVVALAGSFRRRDVDDLSARFSALAAAGSAPFRRGAYQPAFTLKKKAIEQNHLTIAFPGLSYDDPDRFTLQLLSAALGSGLSSRLWQEVRERRGLCYSIYTYSSDHADTGFFGIYTALGRDTEGQALETIRNTVADFADHGVTAEELSRAQDQARTNVLMGLESTQAHMSALGRGELMLGKVLSTDEVLERYASVTREDVRRLAGRIFDFAQVSLSAVGRVADEEQYRAMLTGA
ncbi:M16 family metallopeptidase [Pseudoflavonifractor phocaeensis]|uniref:M16 family metallopeptidase n=1 Tax=Pseudoflavonifractor phocaeensis TaxID=1870988 RepID=UPI0019563715|nr:pitrilysin family protein [Pseudoflavonifractor phocaeensis]MBM6869911.1 insulinase family protein [Pseudoflavonifractor phocaeensis]